MPNIIRVLELSTAHVPEHIADGLSYQDRVPWSGVIVDHKGRAAEYGWWVHVPDELNPDVPAELLRVQVYARSHGCDWIMFDRDADIDPALPTWDW